MSPSVRRSAFAGVSLLLAFVFGTASAQARETPGPASDHDVGTLSGSYLAARHAQAKRDYPAAADFLVQALGRAPDDSAILRRTHFALLLDGRFDDATRVAREIADRSESDAMARLTLAVAAFRDGEPEEAEAALVSDQDAKSVHRLLRPLLRTWALVDQGRFDEGVTLLVEEGRPDEMGPLYHLHDALVRAAAGDDALAEAAFRAAMEEQDPPALRAVDLFGAFLERQGQTEAARKLYADYLAAGSRSAIVTAAIARMDAGGDPPPPLATGADGAAEALFNVAGAVSRQRVPEMALVLARLAGELRGDFPILQILTGQLLEALDRPEDANAVYAAINQGSPLAWQARLDVARNLDRMDQYEEARALLEAMAAERPDDPQPLVDLGDAMRRHEHFEDAVDAYDRAFARIPTIEQRHWSLLYARGIALERSKIWERAEADFKKALELEPDQPLVLNYLGYSWIEMGRNLEEALDMVRLAVEKRPRDGYIVDSLGWAHYRLGQYEDAVTYLERAVELRPEDPVINDHLGDAYWQVGRLREARYQWTTALTLDPEPDVRAAIEEKLVHGLIQEARAEPAVLDGTDMAPDGAATP